MVILTVKFQNPELEEIAEGANERKNPKMNLANETRVVNQLISNVPVSTIPWKVLPQKSCFVRSVPPVDLDSISSGHGEMKERLESRVESSRVEKACERWFLAPLLPLFFILFHIHSFSPLMENEAPKITLPPIISPGYFDESHPRQFNDGVSTVSQSSPRLLCFYPRDLSFQYRNLRHGG